MSERPFCFIEEPIIGPFHLGFKVKGANDDVYAGVQIYDPTAFSPDAGDGFSNIEHGFIISGNGAMTTSVYTPGVYPTAKKWRILPFRYDPVTNNGTPPDGTVTRILKIELLDSLGANFCDSVSYTSTSPEAFDSSLITYWETIQPNPYDFIYIEFATAVQPEDIAITCANDVTGIDAYSVAFHNGIDWISLAGNGGTGASALVWTANERKVYDINRFGYYYDIVGTEGVWVKSANDWAGGATDEDSRRVNSTTAEAVCDMYYDGEFVEYFYNGELLKTQTLNRDEGPDKFWACFCLQGDGTEVYDIRWEPWKRGAYLDDFPIVYTEGFMRRWPYDTDTVSMGSGDGPVKNGFSVFAPNLADALGPWVFMTGRELRGPKWELSANIHSIPVTGPADSYVLLQLDTNAPDGQAAQLMLKRDGSIDYYFSGTGFVSTAGWGGWADNDRWSMLTDGTNVVIYKNFVQVDTRAWAGTNPKTLIECYVELPHHGSAIYDVVWKNDW